jgi:hypothetical protein
MHWALKLILPLAMAIIFTSACQFRSDLPSRHGLEHYKTNQIAPQKLCHTDEYQNCLCRPCKKFARSRNPSAEIYMLRKELNLLEKDMSSLKSDIIALKNAQPPGDNFNI